MLGRWIAVLIVPVAGIMALGFVHAAGYHHTSCFDMSVGVFFWGVVCCLVGAFLCAALFAVCRAPPVAYVVLVAAMTLVATAGSGLVYATSNACGDLVDRSGDVLFFALSFLVASLAGLLVGFLLGFLFVFLLNRLARWWRRA